MPRSLLAFTLVLVAVGGGLWSHRLNRGTTYSPVSPFTATQVENIYEADDPVVAYTSIKTIAVRSDGSSVTLTHFTDPNGRPRSWTRRGIMDLSHHEYVTVDPFGESLSTYPITAVQAGRELRKFIRPCAGEPAGTLLGFDVVANESTEEEPYDPNRPDTYITTAWQAPKLDCFPLRTEMLLYQNGKGGKLTQRTIQAVTNVKLGEPASSLFERPANYIERSPSDAAREAERRYPNHDCCRNISQAHAEFDKQYYQRRAVQK